MYKLLVVSRNSAYVAEKIDDKTYKLIFFMPNYLKDNSIIRSAVENMYYHVDVHQVKIKDIPEALKTPLAIKLLNRIKCIS